jgi:hypothetical protein
LLSPILNIKHTEHLHYPAVRQKGLTPTVLNILYNLLNTCAQWMLANPYAIKYQLFTLLIGRVWFTATATANTMRKYCPRHCSTKYTFLNLVGKIKIYNFKYSFYWFCVSIHHKAKNSKSNHLKSILSETLSTSKTKILV